MSGNVSPNNPKDINGLGLEAFAQQHYDEAEQYFRKAVEINPEDYNAYYNLGFVLSELKRYDEAIEKYEKAGNYPG